MAPKHAPPPKKAKHPAPKAEARPSTADMYAQMHASQPAAGPAAKYEAQMQQYLKLGELLTQIMAGGH